MTLQKNQVVFIVFSSFHYQVSGYRILSFSHQPEDEGRRTPFMTIADWHVGHLNIGLLRTRTS